MAAIVVVGHSPVILARWAFQVLAERAVRELPNVLDQEAVVSAVALDGIFFDMLDPAQARRIARALRVSCDEIWRKTFDTDTVEPIDVEFAGVCADLSLILTDLESDSGTDSQDSST